MKPVGVFLALAAVLAIYGVRMIELATRRQTVPGKVRETMTLRLFMVVGTLLVAGSIGELLLFERRLPWVTFVSGALLAAASFSIRRRAIASLGRFWSLHVEIRENHQFVRSGPFRWVRHPTYFSMILELLAIGLIANAWFSLLLVLVLFPPILARRLNLEESALVEKFGDAYRDYQRTTPALFPYKWRSSK
jgi:protein-S-isoprenylcysteine O-methyltransferase Ste14